MLLKAEPLDIIPHYYICCSYILRRCKEEFRTPPKGDPTTIVAHAKEQLEVLKRQSLVYGLYARKIKNVLVRSYVMLE